MTDYIELVIQLRDGAYFADSRGYGGISETMMQAADAIEELSKPRWISVEERLPEKKREHYLCLLDDNSMNVCYWSNVTMRSRNEWEWHNPNWKDVTHWMPLPPLPEPPKEE